MWEQLFMILGSFLIYGLGNLWIIYRVEKKEYAKGYRQGYEDGYKEGRQQAVQLLRSSALTESDFMDE